MTTIVRVNSLKGLDAVGEPEDFTWDLFPDVDPALTTHLGENGLPKIGTHITPGMIVIGKLGKTPTFKASQGPTCLELQTLAFADLHAKYGGGLEDRSVYATADMDGVVVSASFDTVDGHEQAVVLLKVA